MIFRPEAGIRDLHQRQVAYSVNAPPIKGPLIRPSWEMPNIVPK